MSTASATWQARGAGHWELTDGVQTYATVQPAQHGSIWMTASGARGQAPSPHAAKMAVRRRLAKERAAREGKQG